VGAPTSCGERRNLANYGEKSHDWGRSSLTLCDKRVRNKGSNHLAVSVNEENFPSNRFSQSTRRSLLCEALITVLGLYQLTRGQHNILGINDYTNPTFTFSLQTKRATRKYQIKVVHERRCRQEV
jgi:hypothetical protein